MCKPLLTIVFCFVIGYSFSQSGPEKIVDHFFNLYKDKSPEAALDYLFSTNKWTSESTDDIATLKLKLNGTIKQLGSYVGHTLICKKTIGEHLCLYTFMARYDRQPLRLSILFYSPDGEWRLQNFSYDHDLADELREAASVHRLKENVQY